MTADPHLWLEDVLGKDQLAWVERCNKQCLSDIGDPKVTPCFTRILDILDSKVRSAHSSHT
jgi:prolyl oligopeptidase PreP (S9A serine peptidase family)